eukprot:TRINITY_DN3181_c0_g1_i2.p1 TRINITY_DN3181_c0_g1~~TRINITY_DN3181_c0_g1_i2.p1  ORF type:complete len:283 (-),score=31.94 TRINITY_DN3181_c0_g1_i2:141-989(-)
MYPAKGVALKDFETKWWGIVLFIASLWSFSGGYINAFAFAGVWNTGLTHLTGSTTVSAIRFINPAKAGQYTHWHFLAFILSWFIGSFVVGVVIGPPKFRWGRLQGFLIVLHGIGLIVGWYLAPLQTELKTMWSSILGACCVSFSMGIQNSLTSTWSGCVIRTSHHSGTVLDIGLVLGQFFHRRTKKDLWKIKLFVTTWLSFWIGGLFGTLAWNHLATGALLVPGSITLAVGVGICVWWQTTLSCGKRGYDYQEIVGPSEFDEDRPRDDDDTTTVRHRGYGTY